MNKRWFFLFAMGVSLGVCVLAVLPLLLDSSARGQSSTHYIVPIKTESDICLELDSHCFYLPSIWRQYVTSRPVSGTVEIEDGRCCAGGIVGETITLSVAYEATSPFAEVTEMRTKGRLAGGCLTESEIDQLVWEPFEPERIFPVHISFVNWIGYYVSVQYRDAAGHLSPIFCDDISVEGHPPPPSVSTPP